jgi:hypothetical protein
MNFDHLSNLTKMRIIQNNKYQKLDDDFFPPSVNNCMACSRNLFFLLFSLLLETTNCFSSLLLICLSNHSFFLLLLLDSPMVNMSTSNNSTPRSTSQHHHAPTTTATIPVTRSTIDDFREIIREQSFIIPNNSSSDPNHIDVPIKKYPPLPDIAVPNFNSNPSSFFRTETVLTTPKQHQPKKQMFYHFAPSQRGHLPALNKRQPIITNVMDLDEDLPQCHTTIAQRAATYTSPSDRVISPIKRPSAPSPPASAQIKRLGQNAFVYGEEEQDEEDEEDEENYSGIDDDDDSRLFEENFYRYTHQPITMINNRRINHYNHNRFSNMNDGQSTILFDDEPTHPLDSLNLEP